MSTQVGSHRVQVRLTHRDRSTFLAIVSMLHRRGVDVTEAELFTIPDGTVGFTANFATTDAQAMTVAASLRNLVDVHDAKLLRPGSMAAAT